MSYRYMRIIVFFDLPVTTEKNRKEANQFRKYLIKNGFLMMQESVYCKLVLNEIMAITVIDNVRRNKPSAGVVQALKVTEKQYQRMEYIVGSNISEVIDSDERLIEI